jgi:NADPH:quinone reductase-like Zn-dependent oxidoreductase
MSSTSIPLGHHLAAILPSKGSSLETTHRLTPTPGPNDVLIEVKSLALNPIDYFQRDTGLFVNDIYPTIIGSDVAGTIISTGSSVPASIFKNGTHVAAFATLFWKGYDHLDYGAFQKYVLVPYTYVTPLPDKIGFNEGSLLPMAVQTALSGWYVLGIPRDTALTPADKRGMLVWGGASSVGSAAVQSAKLMGFTVYTTASTKHHDYMKELGASRVFDYKEKNVEDAIIEAAREDGLTFDMAYDAVGQLQSCLDIVNALKGEGTAKIASAPVVTERSPKLDGVKVTFVSTPSEEVARQEHLHYLFGFWLKEKLERGEFVPSPKTKVVGSGLECLNMGMDELKSGVSGVKLVIEI